MFLKSNMDIPYSPSPLDTMGISSRSSPPPLQLLLEKIFLTHATDVLPKDNCLKCGSIFLKKETLVEISKHRKTIHFSLGGLVPPHEQSWEDRKYCLVVPMATLKERLFNIFPYDTFALGDVDIDATWTLIAPEGTVVDTEANISYYTPQETLRDTVNKVIALQNGWQMQLQPLKSALEGTGRIEPLGDIEVNSPSFFASLLEEYPHLSFGSHYDSLHGQAWRLGYLDDIMGILCKVYLYSWHTKGSISHLMNHYNEEDIRFFKFYLQHAIPSLADLASKLEQKPHLNKQIVSLIHECKAWDYILQLDETIISLGIAQFKTFSLQHPPKEISEFLHNKLEELRKNPDEDQNITQDAKYLLTMLSPKASHYNSSKISLKEIASYCHNMDMKELQDFLKEIRFSVTLKNKIIFYYFIERWHLLDTGNEENNFLDWLKQLKESNSYSALQEELTEKIYDGLSWTPKPSELDWLIRQYQKLSEETRQPQYQSKCKRILTFLQSFESAA